MANPQSIWARLGDIDAGARLTGLGRMRREFATRVRICRTPAHAARHVAGEFALMVPYGTSRAVDSWRPKRRVFVTDDKKAESDVEGMMWPWRAGVR